MEINEKEAEDGPFKSDRNWIVLQRIKNSLLEIECFFKK